jgi:hypothetical protein
MMQENRKNSDTAHKRKRSAVSGRFVVAAGLALALMGGTAAVAVGTSSGPPEEATFAGDTVAVRVVGEGMPSAVPETGLARGLVLPLEKYLISYEEMIQADTARRTVEQQCISERGLRWFAPVLYADPAFSNNTMNMPRRYGITVPEQAERYGYDLPVPEEPATTRAAEATDAEAAVLTGRTEKGEPVSAIDGIDVPEGGCYGQSARTVGELDEFLANDLAGQSMVASEAHPDVVAAIGAWSACMARHGFEVDQPYDAAGITTEPATEVAVTDIGCKKEVGLVRTWFAVESRIQQELIAEHRTELEQERQDNAAVLAAAQAIPS